MTIDNFPPIISHLGTQVGKKNELILVIPNTSKLYYIFAKEDDLYKSITDQFISNINSFMIYEDIEEHIVSTQKNETSIIVKLNIEHIKYQTIRIAEDYNPKNPFVFDYIIGHGYVLNIQIVTVRYTNEDIVELYEETKYLAKKCKNALVDIGYKSPFFSSNYKNDKNIAQVWVTPSQISCSLALSIYEKDIYKNYTELENIMKEKNLEQKYQLLNTILK